MSLNQRIGVGAFMILATLLFGFGLFMIGDRRQLFDESFRVTARFSRLAGLANGAKVRVAGIDAGEVVTIDFPSDPSDQFRVTMRIIEALHPLVREDSVTTIQSDGLVGNVILQIGSGSASSPIAANGSTIEGREPFELVDLLQKASDTVDRIDVVTQEVRREVASTFRTLEETVRLANDIVETTGTQTEAIAASVLDATESVRRIAADVEAGKGTVGKLFKDDELYGRTTAIAERIDGISEDVQKTAENVREMTGEAKRTMADFQTDGGAVSGLMSDVRQTLESAREAMSDLAENTESMKRTFLFRGFFLDRGYFDMDSLTQEDYIDGALSQKYRVLRAWIPADELFERDEAGLEQLSEAGKAKVNSEMREILQFPLGSPLMIEGYSNAGTKDESFLVARLRARLVRDYIVNRFSRNPTATAFIAMDQTDPIGVDAAGSEGVILALYHNRDPVPPRHRLSK